MRLALDTNVLAYAEGINGAAMQGPALDVISRLPARESFLPVQVLGELFNLLIRKGGRSGRKAQSALLIWQDAFLLIETSRKVMTAALNLASEHRLQIWDAVILSAASSAGCRLLLSEDLQDGFTWNGLTVVNPFSKTLHHLLADALEL
jgi:predicted nucleic acid-binding protein